jgi:hypothetical protein
MLNVEQRLGTAQNQLETVAEEVTQMAAAIKRVE